MFSVESFIAQALPIVEAFPAAVAIADEVGAIFALEVLVADAFSGDASAFSGAAIEAGGEGAIFA